jgi:pimeloyl-ACP methyl ester carboxylesterase
MNRESHYVTVEGRELHLTEWLPADGAAQAPVVVAWHGLARTGRDMDWIAAHLAAHAARPCRVICPDTIGRGLSAWSPAPDEEYGLDFYERLAEGLLDSLGVRECLWLGTSMGGAIGLRAAAGRLAGRIRRLVMNDIGPELAPAAVARIRAYAGQPPAFATMGELEDYFRTIYRPYGWLSDRHWRVLAETSARRLPDGRFTPHYDPAMVRQFENFPDDYVQWPAWERLALPVLVLRGEHSDLLLPEVAERMRRSGPRAVVATIAGCGHAPALNVPAQFALVERFLLAQD